MRAVMLVGPSYATTTVWCRDVGACCTSARRLQLQNLANTLKRQNHTLASGTVHRT